MDLKFFYFNVTKSHSTAQLLTVLSERIARYFSISGPQTVALHMSNDSVWHAGLAYKLKGCVCYIFTSLFCMPKREDL